MKKSKFSPNQIATMRKEFDAGKKAEDIFRDHRIKGLPYSNGQSLNLAVSICKR